MGAANDVYYFNTSSSSYNLSTACNANTGRLFRDLTTPYMKQLHDASTLSASFIMFALTALFFILNLFSGLSDVSAILDPKVRVGLSSALSLFLPVMSYLFSEAKKIGGGGADTEDVKAAAELPQRARFILIWMLLVELLRKKVEEIRMQGYSGTLERAGRVLWLGSLVFSNLQATGRKAMTGILWVLCVSNLVQRVSFTEFGKRSLAFGKNARLITSYMDQVVVQQEAHQNSKDEPPLESCEYAVMDEDKLVVEAIRSGYKFKDARNRKDAATVGRIWALAETDRLLDSLDRDRRLRRLCLSMSLFKLLRRRFEHLPALTAAETRSYRRLVFRALREAGGATNRRRALTEEALFEVTNDELSFAGEYYHSVIPVVLASPFFLLANYFLVPLVVFVLCLVYVVLCGNGDVPLAFRSMKDDNLVTFFGVTQLRGCLPQVFSSPVVFFCTVDLSITFLLFVMFVYGEVREFFVFLFSDWFLVSLLCKYAAGQLGRRVFGASVRCLKFARSLLHRPAIGFNQLSVLEFCGVTMPAHLPLRMQILVRTADVPAEVKRSVAEYFTNLFDRDGNLLTTAALSNGRNALLASSNHADLLPFCRSGSSVAEVILTWHVATTYLEAERRPHGDGSSSMDVATTLSKYCAYLVAFHPELLPENQDSVEQVFKALKLELYDRLGFWSYYLSPCRTTRHRRIKASRLPDGTAPEEAAAERKAVVRGATLGGILAERAARSDDEQDVVWKVLADLWVELLVYVAPSSDEECVAAHENVLAKGGEFVTVLWAMVTHAGITRPPVTTTEGNITV